MNSNYAYPVGTPTNAYRGSALEERMMIRLAIVQAATGRPNHIRVDAQDGSEGSH